MKLYAINAGHFKLDGGAMFGVVPKSMWNKLNPADENNMCSWAMRCLLIEEDNKLILIDNGMGDKQDAKFFGHYFLHGDDTLDKSLGRYGFTKDDITDVVLTHLHFDHCGGSIIKVGDKLMPAFKYATYWSNESHWQWATNPNDREKASFLKENILPIKESLQLKMVDLPIIEGGAETDAVTTNPSGILPGLSFIIVNGHTEAMMLPVIKFKEKIIVFVADLLPSIAHLPLPYVMAYDMFPMTTLTEKKTFLNWALENDCILFFEHDPEQECCNLKATDNGIRAKEIFRISDV
ncbi:MAG: MBL fold metallo-hydrolase [Aquabacterium sp.]|nr:MBL fold metallo-hydrolase [Ferruginibacter sp.]